MRIIACLSWYRESPTWLAATVASCARFCDAVVAVDGAYALYPQPRARSGADEHEAILRTAEACGMGVTIHVPTEPWDGNEVAKRSYLMRAGVFEAQPGDWLFIIDADEVVIEAPPRSLIHGVLEQTPCPVAEVTLGIRHDHYRWMQASPAFADGAPPVLPDSGAPPFAGDRVRRLMRADPSLRLEGTHYHYRIDGDDGSPVDLWGGGPGANRAPAEELLNVVMEHRNGFRDPVRRDDAIRYYRIREAAQIEKRPDAVAA